MDGKGITAWYHGTSDEADLSVGEYLDPERGAFEPCVWATSSLDAARGYARDRAALGGSPVVYRIELAAGAVVATLATGDEPDWTIDADAMIDERGERGVPTLAILRTRVARIAAIE